MPTLFLIRGVPGSGKTFLANRMINYFEGVIGWGIKEMLHYEADHIMEASGHYEYDWHLLDAGHAYCFGNAIFELSRGNHVIVSNTFTRLFEMQKYIDTAQHIGADVVVIKCDGGFNSVHNVPHDTMYKMRRRWEDYPGEIEYRDFNKIMEMIDGLFVCNTSTTVS